jgi:hypothetical protein
MAKGVYQGGTAQEYPSATSQLDTDERPSANDTGIGTDGARGLMARQSRDRASPRREL